MLTKMTIEKRQKSVNCLRIFLRKGHIFRLLMLVCIFSQKCSFYSLFYRNSNILHMHNMIKIPPKKRINCMSLSSVCL